MNMLPGHLNTKYDMAASKDSRLTRFAHHLPVFKCRFQKNYLNLALAPLIKFTGPARSTLIHPSQRHDQILPLPRMPPPVAHRIPPRGGVVHRHRLGEPHPQIRVRAMGRRVLQEPPDQPEQQGGCVLPHACVVCARVARDVEDAAACTLAAGELGRQETRSRPGHCVQLYVVYVLGTVRIL